MGVPQGPDLRLDRPRRGQARRRCQPSPEQQLPDAEIAWKDVALGALFTAALFVLGKFLLGLYIARSEPGSAYGAAGSLAIILVWVYYSAMIFFLGAEFTQVWARRRGEGIRPDEDAVRVVQHTVAGEGVSPSA